MLRMLFLVLLITSAASIPLEPFVVNITGGPPKPCPVGHGSLPEGTTSIGHDAFIYCDRMTSLDIPDSVTSIGSCAFQKLKNLRYVNISKTTSRLRTIGDAAFQQSGIKALTIPDSVTSIGEQLCSSCEEIETLVIGDGLSSVEKYTCDSCHNLTSITFGKSVTYIGSCAFRGGFVGNNRLTTLKLPKSLQVIESSAFNYFHKLRYLWVPCNVTSIGRGAFKGSKLDRGVDVPKNTTIASDAFSSGTNIRIHNC